jgi:SPP1 gp7 family putative phage head morphogenesis protein
MLHCIFLDSALVDLETASAGLVGNGHHSHYIISVLYELVKRSYGEFRRTHVDDTRLLEISHYLGLDFLETVLQTFRAEDSGVVEKYEFLAAIDSRTSKLCRDKDGKVFKLKDSKVGVNFPPLHPHCRSTIIPVLKDW